MTEGVVGQLWSVKDSDEENEPLPAPAPSLLLYSREGHTSAGAHGQGDVHGAAGQGQASSSGDAAPEIVIIVDDDDDPGRLHKSKTQSSN